MRKHASSRAPAPRLVECDVVAGLEPFARDEVLTRLGTGATGVHAVAGAVRFASTGPLAPVCELRTVSAAFLVLPYRGQRPSVVLSDARLARALASVATRTGSRTFTVSAAGSSSPAMLSIRRSLEDATGLRDAGGGGLLVRLRRNRAGWDALVALHEGPLSARAWRVASLPGAMNATIAAAMVVATGPRPRDAFLNLACGTGTLAIERRLMGSAGRVVALDIDEDALCATRRNARAAGVGIAVVRTDARGLPFRDASFDVVAADLPFGFDVGTHSSNVALYPGLFAEAARVARRGARLVVLSTERRLVESAAGVVESAAGAAWRPAGRCRIVQGAAEPSIYRYVRRT